MKLFNWYFKSNLLVRILAGLILGAVCGLAFGPAMAWVSPFGEIFIRLLKMIVMPVILFTLTVGAASVHPSQLGRVGVKALVIYMITTGFAVVFGLVCGNIFQPGKGMQIAAVAAEGVKADVSTPSLVDTLINVVPVNPFGAIAEGNGVAGDLFLPAVRHWPGLCAQQRGRADPAIRGNRVPLF